MPSEAFEAIVTMMGQMAQQDDAPVPIAERRAAVEQGLAILPVAADVSVEDVDAGGVPCEWVSAPGARTDRTILYLHGGAYTICSPRTHRGLTSSLSREVGVRVLVADYRLAPENPFPAAVEDAVSVYRWLIEGGTSPENIAVVGDSAGGGLTVATLVALRDREIPLPVAAVTISPWADLEMTGESMTTKADVDPMITRERLKESADAYLNGVDARDPLASPLYADLTGLPPLFIHVGGRETLLDDSSRLEERARAAGVDVTLEIEDEMIHVWHVFAGLAPECDEGVRRVASFLNPYLR